MTVQPHTQSETIRHLRCLLTASDELIAKMETERATLRSALVRTSIRLEMALADDNPSSGLADRIDQYLLESSETPHSIHAPLVLAAEKLREVDDN